MFQSPIRSYDFSAFKSPEAPSVTVAPEVVKAARKLGWEGSLYASRNKFIKALPTVLFGLGAFVSFGDLGDAGMFLVMAAVFGTLGVQALLAGRKAQREVGRFLGFAEANNLDFKITNTAPDYPQIPVFNRGFARLLYTMFTTKTEPEFTVGNYRFKEEVNSGKNRRTVTYRRGVMIMPLSKEVPHIVIMRKGSNTLFHKNERLKLGIGVDEKLEVYAPALQHQQALTILTPDVLAAMVDAEVRGRIHLVGDRVVIVFDEPLILRDSSVWTKKLIPLQELLWFQLHDQVNRYSGKSTRESFSAEEVESEPLGLPERQQIKRSTFATGNKSIALFAAMFGLSSILFVLFVGLFL